MVYSNPRSFYSLEMDVSTPGAFSGQATSFSIDTYINASATAKQAFTVVVPASVDNSQLYTVVVDGISVEFTTDASATQAELQAGLLAAYVQNPEANSLMSAEAVGNDIVLTSRRLEDLHIVSVNNNGATNLLTVSQTTAQSFGSTVPYGVFVARANGDAVGQAKLPAADTDQILGVTTIHQNKEKNSVGNQAVTEYAAQEVMDVLSRCNGLDGVWVRCVETDLTIDDPVYVVATGANAGYATKEPTGNIDLSGVASFRSETKAVNRDNTGNYIVLVRLNLI